MSDRFILQEHEGEPSRRTAAPFRRAAARLAICAAVLLVAGAAPLAAQDFDDVTVAAGLDFVGTYGLPFFVSPDPFITVALRNIGHGAAVGDYDGDGDLDVYMLGQYGESNRLYRNNLDMSSKTFTDVTPAVLADLGMSRVAHFADLDNDGDLDLVLVNDVKADEVPAHPPSKIFRNDGASMAGDPVFTDVTAGSNFQPFGYLHGGCALADYDLDGLIDVYTTVWAANGENGPATFPGWNQLYRNLGGFVFSDVSDASGLGMYNKDSFTAIFKDFDGDLYPDIYIAVDNGPDIYYRNNAGTFSDATGETGTDHGGNDMGAAPADFDDDGDLDLFTSNITDPDGIFGRLYNNFYVNQQETLGTPFFVDEAEDRGVEDASWGWGTEFLDVENDGDLDLVVVNGFDEWVDSFAQMPDPQLYQTPSALFINDGTGNFTRLTGTALDTPDDSRALIAFDYDRDGDLDLLISNANQPMRLMENVSTGQGHWLGVALEPDNLAIGATVYATLGATTKRRDVIAGRSYLSGTPSEVHFGLGDATVVDTLRVVWADGTEVVHDNVAADQLLRIDAALIFADGFESGNTTAWSSSTE